MAKVSKKDKMANMTKMIRMVKKTINAKKAIL